MRAFLYNTNSSNENNNSQRISRENKKRVMFIDQIYIQILHTCISNYYIYTPCVELVMYAGN